MYKVICYFTDLKDRNHPYHVGDIFPREGMEVSEKRLQELSGRNNKRKRPLIELVRETSNNKIYTKTEINRMSTADLKSFAAENGIEDAELKSGSELKKLLIEKLGL